MTVAVQMSSVLPFAHGVVDTAVVQSSEGGRVLVEAAGVTRPARLALSCLVMPEPGDRVLVAEASGTGWVLAILERGGPAPVQVRLPHMAEVSSPGHLTIAADAFSLRTRSAQVLADELSCFGRTAAVHVGTLRLIGQAIETLVDRVLLRARRSSRTVTELDEVQSATISHRADGMMHLHAGHVLVSAKGIAKIDASQIHMG